MAVTLLFVADPELRTDLTKPVFGWSVLRRNVDKARQAGFDRIAVLAGIREEMEDLPAASVGEPLEGPVVIVLEGTSVTAQLFSLLRRTLEHPSWREEERTIYDAAGRPALYMGAQRRRVPGRMPIVESADLPAQWGVDLSPRPAPTWRQGDPGDAVVRVVQDIDMRRVEAQLLREVGLEPSRMWHRWASIPLLRVMSRGPVTLAQWELACVLVGCAGAALILLDTWTTLVLGVALALLAVEWTLLLPRWVRLIRSPAVADVPDRTEGLLGNRVHFAGAVRPVVHAALLLALGYAGVVEPPERLRLLQLSVADLTVLSVSAAGALMLLARSRALLRGGGWGQDLALARFDRFLSRLGVAAPWGRDTFALLEAILTVVALSGQALAVWWVLLVASASRLWRWALRPVTPADTPRKPA